MLGQHPISLVLLPWPCSCKAPAFSLSTPSTTCVATHSSVLLGCCVGSRAGGPWAVPGSPGGAVPASEERPQCDGVGGTLVSWAFCCLGKTLKASTSLSSPCCPDQEKRRRAPAAPCVFQEASIPPGLAGLSAVTYGLASTTEQGITGHWRLTVFAEMPGGAIPGEPGSRGREGMTYPSDSAVDLGLLLVHKVGPRVHPAGGELQLRHGCGL